MLLIRLKARTSRQRCTGFVSIVPFTAFHYTKNIHLVFHLEISLLSARCRRSRTVDDRNDAARPSSLCVCNRVPFSRRLIACVADCQVKFLRERKSALEIQIATLSAQLAVNIRLFSRTPELHVDVQSVLCVS